MHIIADSLEPLRQLERKRATGEIDEPTYRATYAALEAQEAAYLCDNGDGRPAYVVVDGKRLCAACAQARLRLRGRRGL